MTTCEDVLLKDMAALASQTENPIAPFPVLFSGRNCMGGLTGIGVANFPEFYKSINCPDTGIPDPDDNCMRVIQDFDGTFNPLTGPPLDQNQVNFLPGATDPMNPNKLIQGNVFSDNNTDRMLSWYVPPTYEVYFYKKDPSQNTRDDAAAAGYIKYGGEDGSPTLVVNGCIELRKLSNGDGFYRYYNNQAFLKPCKVDPLCLAPPYNSPLGCFLDEKSPETDGNGCVAALCQCRGQPGSVASGSDNCIKGSCIPTCPGVAHNAPYFVVVQRKEFSKVIAEMCVQNKPFLIGAKDLRRVWKAQTSSCDNFMTNVCSTSDLAQSDFKEDCACFTQQIALDNQYGASLDVPVCCFGTDPGGDVSKDCAFSSAYKTDTMLENCCSFAECEKVVEKSPGMRAKADPPGEIKCDGKLVMFPTPTTTPLAPGTTVSTETKKSIPFWAWLILGLGVIMLIIFIVLLAFVVKLPLPTAGMSAKSRINTTDIPANNSLYQSNSLPKNSSSFSF